MEQHTLPAVPPRAPIERDGPQRAAASTADATLARFERAFERTLTSLLAPIDGSPLAEAVRWHFGIGCDGANRGKRVRPRLLFAVAFDEGATFDEALDAALGIELLHNYSLVHDDIEDRDLLRRGRETVWSRFGFAQGINAGDGLCAITYLTMLTNSGSVPFERVATITRALHRANLAMCVGQSYDLAFEEAESVSLPEYLAMIDGKTAALFGAACELGALCAGADESRSRAYADVGLAYGRAFQIRDDVFGTRDDIARRKWSFPIVWALAGPASPSRSVIAERYARPEPLGGDDVSAVANALEQLGARAAAESACTQQIRRADRLATRHGFDARGNVRAQFASL